MPYPMGSYAHFAVFVDLLAHGNSYIRTRALRLSAANGRWDRENRIDEIIDACLAQVMDPSPIAARQCIQALPLLAKHKPHLEAEICRTLRRAKPHSYPSTMVSLVQKDIQNALGEIEQ